VKPAMIFRLLWVAPLTVLTAIGAVLTVRVLAVALLHPSDDFAPLGWLLPILDTAVLVSIATLVFLIVALLSGNPIRSYQIIAACVLVVSFWPDIAIARSWWAGATWSYAVALMMMHVTAWAVTVNMLAKLTHDLVGPTAPCSRGWLLCSCGVGAGLNARLEPRAAVT
jgi:hypothetical protein